MGIFVWPHGKKNQVLDNLKIDMLDFHGFSISMVMSFQALLYLKGGLRYVEMEYYRTLAASTYIHGTINSF